MEAKALVLLDPLFDRRMLVGRIVIHDQVQVHPRGRVPVHLPEEATYAFQRVIEHGRRRGEEMQEAARTVRDAGLAPLSAAGTAQRDTWMAEQGDAGVFGTRGAPGFARSDDWRVEADRLLHSSANDGKKTPT